MEDLRPIPSQCLLHGQASDFLPAVVHKIHRAVRQGAPNYRWNGFEYVAQLFFTLTGSLFGALAIFDVGQSAVPFQNISFVVSQWNGASEKPAVVSMGIAMSSFAFE